MEDNFGKYIVLDGKVKTTDEPVLIDSTSGKSAYEVIRIINGVPLFFEDHFYRMSDTFKVIGSSLEMTADQLKESIKKLLAENEANNCNVKIVVFDEEGRRRQLAYISKSYYPSEEEADEGVITGLLQIERHNPNAKVLNKSYKDAVTAKIQEHGFFEVILVDSSGRITEGSKSNAFFVKNNSIYTAPGEAVLKGITRKYAMEACSNAGYDVKEEFVKASELDNIDGAFLSGTSIKVLPIKSIDSLVMNSSDNPVVSAVRREYGNILEKYIENNVKTW